MAENVINPQTLQLMDKYGVAIVALVAVAGFLGALIWYILRQNQMRENKYMNLITNDLKHQNETSLLLTKTLNDFSSNVNEAHKYQREEHNKILDNQEKICFITEKTNIVLDNVKDVLIKLNGK
jgi:uncharacterized protein HemX